MLGGKSNVAAYFFCWSNWSNWSDRGCFAWFLCGVVGSGVRDIVNGFCGGCFTEARCLGAKVMWQRIFLV